MNETLLASHLLLWVVVLVLAGVVVALVRQIGILHERVAPVGALAVADGIEVGAEAPVLRPPDLTGRPVEIGRASAQSTLLFFLSPTCPVCKTLLPSVRRVVAAQTEVRLVLASDGPVEEHRAFVAAAGLEGLSYVVSTELGLAYRVAKLPYAVLIDRAGIVRARGLVNTREHVESLFEAEARGVGSVQEFLADRASRERVV